MHAYAYANANAMQLRTKHLKCYKRLLREEKHVFHFPTSAISWGYLAPSIREANLVKTIFWYSFFVVNFCLNNFLHWLPWSTITLGGIQDSTVLHSRYMESATEHKLTTRNTYFSSGYSIGHMNFALDRKLLKVTRYNGSMFVRKIWKIVLYQSSLSTTFHTGWDHRRVNIL
jgi:hypothetical protein